MYGNRNGTNTDVLAAMNAALIQETQEAARVQMLTVTHLEIMRTVYLKLIQVEIDNNTTVEAMDVAFLNEQAEMSKLVADRFMIANGFMAEPK